MMKQRVLESAVEEVLIDEQALAQRVAELGDGDLRGLP